MLHLSLAWMKSSSSRAASLNWNSVWPNFCSDTQARDAEAVKTAFAEAAAWDRDLIAGIAAYREYPYARQMQDPPCRWEEGESRLLDYGGAGTPVLFVPSLINRAYILDLMEGGSMLRFLAGQGMHPYLLDWGWPGEAERRFSLTDYIAGRLERAIAAIPGPIVLVGYCMGGLLALASALRLGPEKITGLGLLATPWDFHAADPAAAKRLGDTVPALEAMMGFSGTLPIDALNTLFTMIDPFGIGEKYRDFASQDKTSLRARRFVAMEDWLADGVPLAAPVAREALGGWYGANSPARLQWHVAGLAVNPAHLQIPSFCAFPARDRLVPASSARPLAALLPKATIQEPKTGHIGMVAGTNAQSTLWTPFTNWLLSL
jgi:polyhydroxyalkanoate synthase